MFNGTRNTLFALLTALGTVAASAPLQPADVPKSYSNIFVDTGGQVVFVDSTGSRLPTQPSRAAFTLERLRRTPSGTADGVAFDFASPDLSGLLYYGFIPSPDKVRYPYPVFFPGAAKIDSGRAKINIKSDMNGAYDFIDWQKTGVIRLGYRVVDREGRFLYDGKIVLKGRGPFDVDTCLIEGPFISLVTPAGAVVSFETNYATRSRVLVGGQVFWDTQPATHHEIALSQLKPDSQYSYTLVCGGCADTYSFRTAPRPGSRQPFTFAFASDARGNRGGGERNIKGVNAYMLKRIAVLAADRGARFLQFTGDLVSGYITDEGEMALEYANWKRAVEPFAHYFPFVAGFGNHECLLYGFGKDGRQVEIDKFPFATNSAEAIFAANFVNPKNGPASEDGSSYDPDSVTVDFPPYNETVFYYVYDNVAMIVLNSNYWYAATVDVVTQSSGNLHGYLMDNQLAWLRDVLDTLERDEHIDHVFVTLHTPLFPNGGHVEDDMWYGGNNTPRAVVAGKSVAKGIIERRDELLDLLMNHSSKVVATLTGDEHNYSLLRVSADMPMYPENYRPQRLARIRPFWHITNGAGGAPYYGQEKAPWSSHVRTFSTQNALVLFHVNGRSIGVEVINPDTMELIDKFEM